MSCVSYGHLAQQCHHCINTAADDQSFCHSAKLLNQHIPNIFCLSRQVRLYDKEAITRLFSYRPAYQTLSRQQPSPSPRAVIDAPARYIGRYENSRVIIKGAYLNWNSTSELWDVKCQKWP